MIPHTLQGKIDYLLKYGELKIQTMSATRGSEPIEQWWNVLFTFGWFHPDCYTYTYLGADDTDLSNALHDIIMSFMEGYSNKLKWGWWDEETER